MSAPHRPNAGSHPLPKLAEAQSTPETARGSYLRLLPMDPHRLFAYWKLSAPLVEEARRTVGRPALSDDLLVRVFQLDGLNTALSRARATETFPVNSRRRETRIHLSRPGGYVVAILGIQDRHGRYFPLLRSSRVALPEAPARSDALERTPLINETAVLRKTAIEGLPPELLRLPGDVTLNRVRNSIGQKRSETLPQTPALNERQVVTNVLNHTADESATSPEPSDPTAPAAASRHAASSRLAPSSHNLTGGVRDERAPISLHAVLVAEGFPGPGERLFVAGIESRPDPNGRYRWILPCDDFSAAWKLLKEPPAPETVATPGTEPTFIVELEGEVRDPSYLAKLPRGLTVDAAGRFRAARRLPRDHALVPEWTLQRQDSSAA